MHSPPPFPHSATWHARFRRAEGQLAAMERVERSGEGQNVTLSLPSSLFPLPSSLFRRRLLIPALRPVRCEVLLEVPPMFPAILQQRVPFISLISFPTVKSRLPFFPRLQSSFRGRLQSLPPSLPPSLHSCMPPQCDAPRHFESENGVRIRGISQLRRWVIRFCHPFLPASCDRTGYAPRLQGENGLPLYQT